MKLRTITPPSEEFVSLAEAKQFLRVTHDHEDIAITGMIAGARKWCENACRRSFLTQTWEASYEIPKVNGFSLIADSQRVEDPDEILPCIRLPRGPFQAIVEVSVYNANTGAGVILQNTEYNVVDGAQFYWGQDSLARNAYADRLIIRYLAGHSAAEFRAAFPDLVQATLILLGNLYENRGFASQAIPIEAQNIITRYWLPL